MPEGYEKMRDAFIKRGLGVKEAKAKAAAIWNSRHPENPVHGGQETTVEYRGDMKRHAKQTKEARIVGRPRSKK